MRTNRDPWVICILSFLLLHATILMSWPQVAGNSDVSPLTFNMEVTSEHLNCHDTGDPSTIFSEKGCVFCGFVTLSSRSRLSVFVSLQSVILTPVTAAAPRSEHPVETPPPKIFPHVGAFRT